MQAAIENVGGCRDCGYDLRGLESRNCPECGRAFDPGDKTTIGPVGTPFKIISRWALSRISVVAWIFTAAIIATILWEARFPSDVREFEIDRARGLWPILIVFWSARLLAEVLTKARLQDREFRQRIRVARTATVMLVIVGFALVVRTDLISKAAMRLSRPAFERLAREISTSRHQTFSTPRWAGLYLVEGGQRCYGIRLYSVEVSATFAPASDSDQPPSEWECTSGQREVLDSCM